MNSGFDIYRNNDKKWIPRVGQTYYFVCVGSRYRSAFITSRKRSKTQNKAQFHFNCFKTKEEAELLSNRFNLLMRTYSYLFDDSGKMTNGNETAKTSGDLVIHDPTIYAGEEDL